MKTDVKVLDLLYRQVAPEGLLEDLILDLQGEHKTYTGIAGRLGGTPPLFIDERMFLDYAEPALPGYSEDEQKLMYRQLEQQRKKWDEREKVPASNFDFLLPLIRFSEEHLTMVGGEVVCKAGKIMDWRDGYLKLGQDLFVCAYFAWKDYKADEERKDFSWPVILRVENHDLNLMLQQGIAENHNHLNGGTQSFQITWCRTMNFPGMIREELSHFRGSGLHIRTHRGKDMKIQDVFDMLELSALIRTILFRAIHREEFAELETGDLHQRMLTDSKSVPKMEDRRRRKGKETAGQFTEVFNGRSAFAREYVAAFSMMNNLEKLVDILRICYGVRADVLGKTDYCIDYAMEESYACASIHADIRTVIGERSFLYRCMRFCMREGAFTSFEKKLFYLYLVLQCNFRSEMIQNNGQVGFANFRNYQDRKDDSWDLTPYFGEAARMAINNRIREESIVSLEARLNMKEDPDVNINKAVRFDLAQRYASCRLDELWDRNKYEIHKEVDIELAKEMPYFFVYHYFKVEDDRKLVLGKFSIPVCRHENHRLRIKNQSKGLAKALRKSPYLRCRIRGIDAASDEFLCRPEVFAVGYRYLDAVQKNWNTEDDGLLPSVPIRLSKTFHAGEDFLDIASGIRAIDEALRFMHMEPHSRIGHALALGVDPVTHYTTKHHEIIITKQERLDDLVWILFRAKELGIVIDYALEAKLEGEANRLFREIYGETLAAHSWDSNLNNYRYSMLLRGDDPSVYRSGFYEPHGMDTDEYNAYLIDTGYRELDLYRHDQQIAGLYAAYHYGITEGIRGNETCIIRIEKDYIQLMEIIQNAMIAELAEKEIIIECNPSSNVLIGTFGDYLKHPIFRFNNRKLGNCHVNKTNSGNNVRNVQLHVCVNTDDLGVFDTSLDFEYALLYEALRKKREEASGVTYSDRDILEYLNDLREMGIQASFLANM